MSWQLSVAGTANRQSVFDKPSLTSHLSLRNKENAYKCLLNKIFIYSYFFLYMCITPLVTSMNGLPEKKVFSSRNSSKEPVVVSSSGVVSRELDGKIPLSSLSSTENRFE